MATTASAVQPRLIAVDWGTSNFRAFLLNASGQLLEKKFARQGVLRVSRKQFEAVLMKHIHEWLSADPQLPIVMSGMIGSRQGWLEVPYLFCPVDLSNLTAGMQQVSAQHQPWIVSGIRIDYPDGRVDVMRGEETQILGALNYEQSPHHLGSDSQVFCLPGTHCKWAWVENQKLMHFSTFMTGEIFTLLAKHSILGKLMRNTRTDFNAFNKGLDWAEKKRPLLSSLFQVRTQVLAGKLHLHEVHSFLSGLMIGEEISQAMQTPIPNKKVTLIGNSRIAKLYAICLARHGVEGLVMDVDEVTVRGLYRVAQAKGLL